MKNDPSSSETITGEERARRARNAAAEIDRLDRERREECGVCGRRFTDAPHDEPGQRCPYCEGREAPDPVRVLAPRPRLVAVIKP